jgi:tRNA (guanine-N7-)-methyltransferase
MSDVEHPRPIRSFVTRSGRITAAQQRALDLLWPSYGIEFEPRRLDLAAHFGRSAPRCMEIGFGNGENLAAIAAAHPDRDYLGVEVHRSGVGRLMLSLEEQALTNVRIICHDAVEVLDAQIAPDSLDEVLVLFPDPWPKKRHHKRRLIQPELVTKVASRLRDGGILRLATDWEPYAQHMLETIGACPQLANLSPRGDCIERPADRIPTRFEKRGERLGHGVWDFAFRRI